VESEEVADPRGTEAVGLPDVQQGLLTWTEVGRSSSPPL
jgi:hypothetical protein